MMFYGLCAALCLSAFFLITVCAAGPSLALTRALRSRLRRTRPRLAANLLFAVRILPLALAGALTFGLVLPSFLKLEPRVSGESMGLKLLFPALAGAALAVSLAARAVRSLRATSRVERQWLKRSQIMLVEGFRARVYCVNGAFPLLAVTGLFRPRVFVGRAVLELLSPAELRAALAHEMAHDESFDNLKQLLLRVARLPRWLDSLFGDALAWTTASEAAADEAALTAGTSPVDLSSALVKMGRANRRRLAGGEVLASQFTPQAASSALFARVAQLERWIHDGPPAAQVRIPVAHVLLPFFALAATAAYVAYLPTLLPWIHAALETFVR